jgi:hypothetical protein
VYGVQNFFFFSNSVWTGCSAHYRNCHHVDCDVTGMTDAMLNSNEDMALKVCLHT